MRTRKRIRYDLIGLNAMVVLAAIAIAAVIMMLLQLPKQGNRNPENTGGSTPPVITATPAPNDVMNTTDLQDPTQDAQPDAHKAITTFAAAHNLSINAWPRELIKMLDGNPDTKDFVLNYPLKKDLSPTIDLSEYKDSKSVPLLLQWDERWGYTMYGDEIMGLSGCGPTCLSMVCIYLLNDAKYTPPYIADFAERNGYYAPGSGSTWTLISRGAVDLGLDVTEIPLDESRIIRNLEVDNPIICVMGPGDFTTTGHFIVMTGYVDGKIKVNDPNSPTRSGMLWDYDDIKGQIRNLWVLRNL